MAFAAFQQVWPDALKSGENEDFVIYEYRDSTLYYTDFDRGVAHWTMKTRNHEYLQRVLFFFADGVLMRYETVAHVVEING
jgi:hypothetical protein